MSQKREGSGFGVQGSGAEARRAPFQFVDDPAAFRDDAALVVHIPAGLRSKQKLLAILAERLRFPGYFGWNWDSLEECLRDLSWLPAGQRVAIVHEDLPFGEGGENRSIYLSVLAAAVDREPGPANNPVAIVFPTGTVISTASAPDE